MTQHHRNYHASVDTGMQPAKRRGFIGLLGGGLVLAAAPLLSGCTTGMPPEAISAWRDSANPPDVRRFMLAHALLAPNPHNRQPWIADLRREGEITLLCDGERLLPETDPYGRQILIGFGAFIELAVMAAAERGMRTEVRLFPDGEPVANGLPGNQTIARLILTRDNTLGRDPLFETIRRRHTNKGAYDSDRKVPGSTKAALVVVPSASGLRAGVIEDVAQMQRARVITREAYEIECVTPRTWLESAHLLRIGPSEISRHRDGISLTETRIRVIEGLGLWNRFDIPARGSSGYTRVMERWDTFETGSGYYWLSSRGNSRTVQVEAGRAYVRAQLTATAAGLDIHPLSQALQEFPEMRGPYRQIHELLQLDPARETLQMFSRIGYAKAPASPTPRRDLSNLIRA